VGVNQLDASGRVPAGADHTLTEAGQRAPVVILVFDRHGKVGFANPVAHGLGLDALTEELADSVRNVQQSDISLACEIAIAHEGVAVGWWSIALSPLPDGCILAIGADVTKRKELEAQLRRREAMLVDTQGVAHMGTWEWDVTKPNATWSPELYRIYGLREDEYVPSYEAYLEKVHPDDRERVVQATERVFKEHEPYSHDERILRPDGSIRYLHTWAYPVLSEESTLVRLVGVCQDITERRLAELALEERAEQLALANARLVEEIAERERVEQELRQAHKLEAIGRLAGGIAHDFNNLLGVITLRSSALGSHVTRRAPNDRDVVADVDEAVAEILGAARQAARLTQHLLTFSRQKPVSFERVDLRRVVRDLGDILERTLGENVRLVTRLDDHAPFVEGDRAQLDQVVLNLIINARDAMRAAGGGQIEVELLSLSELEEPPPRDLDRRDYVVLRVSDTGVGMDERVQARIFDPYFTTKEAGNGLGLSTVYGIVRQSGGAITVSSAPNRGTRLTLFFPRAQAAMEPERAAPTSAKVRRRTVLLVEDQDDNRRLMRIILGDLGHDVIEAASPAEALTVAEREGSRLDLLITDVLMPELNGVDLARRILALAPQVCVLYVSGWAHSSLLDELSQGALLLQKPFTSEELGEAISSALANRSSAASRSRAT
jgi:PAS domain S-box-containing protein